MTLKKSGFIALTVLTGLIVLGFSQEKKRPEKNFFENSLHFTSRGISFWYAKEQGGVERLTGVPITSLNCLDCHVKSCDACHAKPVDGGLAYSAETARSQTACVECHGFGDVPKMKADKLFVDVHLEKCMKCMDCHTAREIHGDGRAYDTYRQEGALDVSCVRCHDSLSSIPSHEVHQGKLDCNVCHVRELPSCHNCHMDTRIRDKKSRSLPLKDALFLVNSRGRVTLATCLTFVYQKKTMIEFSPSFPHTVSAAGRACPDCHDSKVVRDINKGSFRLAAWKDGQLTNAAGVVPVLEGMDWNLPFFDYVQDAWVPIPDAAKPLVQYSGYCTPLSAGQFKAMAAPQAGMKKATGK